MAYNTGNPLGSTDSRDLSDNAENFDRFANGADPAYNDRFGVSRKSFAGMEADFQQFLLNSGYDYLGAYAAGIEFTEYNQYVVDGGEAWFPDLNTALPYTTTGTGLPEGGALMSRGEAVLRQQLASTAPGEGASLVSMEGGPSVEQAVNERVIRVGSVANMVADTSLYIGVRVSTAGYYTAGDGGGNDYEIVAGGTGTADGGSFIDLDNGLQARGLFIGGKVYASQFGAQEAPADSTAAITAIEASGFNDIDLSGLDVETTLLIGDLSKRYQNGNLYYQSQRGDKVIYENESSENDYFISPRSKKTPAINWENRDVLWLGTSIPAFGQGEGDSYPQLFAKYFKANVDNLAWAGSHAGYDVNGDPFSLDTVKALSMTEDDRQAGLAAYGSSSAYDDSFDAVTKASQQTADARIKQQFEATPYSAVFLDHNHNDRFRAAGTLSPESTSVSSVTKGSTTTITLSSQIFSVGDAVGLRITGIGDLDYLAARVQSVSGNDITVNVDSSAMSGTFSSGTAYKFDRSTVYGAWEFLIFFIRNSAITNGAAGTNIILCSAPSKYTNDDIDGGVYSNSIFVKNVADKYGLSFFDIANAYEVNKDQHLVLFPDAVHPSTSQARKALSAYWINWAAGGKVSPAPASDYLPAADGADGNYKANREPLFDGVTGGFNTPDVIFSDPVAIDNFTFSGGLTGWATTGTTATAVSDPDGSADTSIKFDYTPSTPVYISRSLSSTTAHPEIVFNVWFDSVSGINTSGQSKIVTALRLREAGGVSYEIQLVFTAETVRVRCVYYDSPGSGQNILTGSANELVAGQDNIIKLTVFKVTAENSRGRIILSLNDVEVLNSEAATGTLGQVSDIDTGVVFTNLTDPLTYYVNRIGVFGRTADDYRDRFTGSFTAQSGETVTVVNGIITSAV